MISAKFRVFDGALRCVDFAGGGDVRSGGRRAGRRSLRSSDSPRRCHRRTDHRQVNWQGCLCRRPGRLRHLRHEFQRRHANASRRICSISTAIEAGAGVSSLAGRSARHRSTAAASAASPATTASGTTSFSASKLNYMHGKFGGSQTDSLSRVLHRPDRLHRRRDL